MFTLSFSALPSLLVKAKVLDAGFETNSKEKREPLFSQSLSEEDSSAPKMLFGSEHMHCRSRHSGWFAGDSLQQQLLLLFQKLTCLGLGRSCCASVGAASSSSQWHCVLPLLPIPLERESFGVVSFLV